MDGITAIAQRVAAIEATLSPARAVDVRTVDARAAAAVARGSGAGVAQRGRAGVARGAAGEAGRAALAGPGCGVLAAEVGAPDLGAVRGPVAVAPRGGPAKEPFVHDVHGV